MVKGKNIVLGVTAGISIYKSCDIVRRLREDDFSVTVVMTGESEKLISPVMFQSLSGNKVYRNLFEQPDSREIEHVSLAGKADLLLIAPATANIIGKISAGICDDLLTCVISATKAKVLICPAMNQNMYLNKITQRNIKTLKDFGYRFVEPRKGNLACGKFGIGCLAEVETIVKEAKRVLAT